MLYGGKCGLGSLASPFSWDEGWLKQCVFGQKLRLQPLLIARNGRVFMVGVEISLDRVGKL